MKRNQKKIALIESSDIAVRYSAEAANSLGFEPVFFADLKSYQADPLAQLRACHHYDCDTSSTSALHTFLRSGLCEVQPEDFIGITTFADTRLQIATDLAKHLGTRGIDPAVILLKDKAKVIELIPEYSPASVLFRTREIPTEKIRALLENGPVIVKPVAGAGAMGTTIMRKVDDLYGLAAALSTVTIPSYMGGDRWLAQAMAQGGLVSFEGFVQRGEVRILGCTDRRKVGQTESAARFPVDSTLPHLEMQRAKEAIHALVSRSGFRNGYFHIEFIIEPGSCSLIDANMGRVGGGAIAEQLALSYGHDPMEIFRHILQITLFEGEGADRSLYSTKPKESFAIFYGLAHHDEIESLQLPSGLPYYHTQILGTGAKVYPMGENDWAWIGIVSGFSSDTEKALKLISIKTKTGEFPPCY